MGRRQQGRVLEATLIISYLEEVRSDGSRGGDGVEGRDKGGMNSRRSGWRNGSMGEDGITEWG